MIVRTQITQQPKVSVVIPAYNTGTTINAAIESILCQTFSDFEILIGDDASTDNTTDLIASISDKRIRLLKSQKNIGAGAQRDRLMSRATGRWIAFCDGDDAWHPQRLEALLNATNNDENIIAFDNFMRCHSNMVPWRPLRSKGAFGEQGKPVHIQAHQLIGSSRTLIQPLFSQSLLFKSGARHSYHAYAEDTYFLLKLLLATQQLVYVPAPYYLYRTTPGSASQNNYRHSLLLQVLASAESEFEHLPLMQLAIRKQIGDRRCKEQYLPFINAIKQRNITLALSLFSRSPSLITEFIVRSFGELPYNLHRLWHGGRTRGSK